VTTEVSSAPEKVCKRNSEGSGDAEQDGEGRVGLSVLEAANQRSADPHARRGDALAPTARRAEPAQTLRERKCEALELSAATRQS
jgi:hypothetical protein